MAKKKKSSNLLEVQNAAKTLFANIRFMSPDEPIRSIVMTSSVPNEGKSTCSVELARAIATSGKTVAFGGGRHASAHVGRHVERASSRGGVFGAHGRHAAVAGRGRHADSEHVLPGCEPNIPNPRRHHLVQALPQAGVAFGGGLRLRGVRHASGGHVHRRGHPVHVGGRHRDGGEARLHQARRACGRLRAIEEGRCERFGRVRHVLRGHRFRVLLRVLHQRRRQGEGR